MIALPEDMLTRQAAIPDAPRVEPVETHPGVASMESLHAMLAGAETPVLILGGSGWSGQPCGDIRVFAERYQLPAATSLRRQMLFPADHPNCAGEIGIAPNPKLKARIAEADVVILAGGRMGEMPSQAYTLFDIPSPRQRLIHIHAGAEELGRVYQPALAIHASPGAFAAAAAALPGLNAPPWAERTLAAHQEFLAWSGASPVIPGKLQMAEAMAFLRGRLPADCIVTNGAGNYATWAARFLHYRSFGSQIAPTSGSMGFGIPAAIGAKRAAPHRMAVAFAGDGCFLMNGQEFATAVQYELPVICIVIDNGMLGTIRMHQEREYPGRVSATTLRNPDFAAYARAFGGHGETVRETHEFAPAFERAVASGKPAILHCLVDGEAITPTATITSLRDAAVRAGK